MQLDHTIIHPGSQCARYNAPLIGDTNEQGKVFAVGRLLGSVNGFSDFIEQFRHYWLIWLIPAMRHNVGAIDQSPTLTGSIRQPALEQRPKAFQSVRRTGI
jgi:hypothetical protein